MAFNIETNEKYALISINGGSIDNHFPEELKIGRNIWIRRKLPFSIPDHWKQWMGELFVDDINDSNLFILTKKVANNIESLDLENKKLSDTLYYYYLAILISDTFRCKGTPFQITGAHESYRISVRQIVPLPEIFFTKGIKIKPFDIDTAKDAKKITSLIKKIYRRKKFLRFKRVLRAFLSGLQSSDITERHHNFVRCIEGFILPDIGKTRKQFISRSSLFLSPHDSKLIGEIYDIRCDIEHMHSAFNSISAQDKNRVFENRTIISEHIARYCINRLFNNKSMWSYFKSDNDINAFWKMTESQRKTLWGSPLDMSKIRIV